MAVASTRKRVLFLAPYLGDGGINIKMLATGIELQRLGWEVAACTGKPLNDDGGLVGVKAGSASAPPIAADYERAGIAHFEVSFPRRVYRRRAVWQLLKMPVALWQILRAVRRFRPSLLHSYSRQMGLYGRIVQLLTGVPLVSSVNNPIPTKRRIWSFTIGARAFAVSRECEEILIRDYAVDPSRVSIVFSGADHHHFRPPDAEEREAARKHYGVRRDQYVLAFIGTLDSNKSPDTLVRAVGRPACFERNVVALLAGQGPLETMLRTLSSELEVEDRVRLLGYEDARRVLWAADALVLPSRSEGFGRVVAEAMLSGVVVLRTPAGGADELTPDTTAVVFPHGDDEELADRVADLIDRPEFANSIALNARVDARERFTLEQMTRKIAEAYEEVLAEQRV